MNPRPAPRAPRARLPRWTFVATALGAVPGCRRAPPAARVVSARPLGGMYWGRFGDVPDGMRVQVWLDSDGTRVRGAYSAMPYNGELEGRVTAPDALEVDFLEQGITRSVGARQRHATLRVVAPGGDLRGRDAQGGAVELVRAGFPSPALREGAWIARWTGLPFGFAVETRLRQHPDGHWRAVYQYQGAGGVRDGSFDGEQEPATGALRIRWMEVTESGMVARGQGRLAPSPAGLRGTFGIEGGGEDIGEWVLEPFEP